MSELSLLPEELQKQINAFLSTVIELEKEDYHNDLVPFSQHAAEIREKGAALFIERQRKLDHGKALLQELFEEENNPPELSFAVYTAAVAAYKEKMKEADLTEAKSLQEELELPQAFMHRGLQVARKLLDEEKYEDAESLFLFLHFLQPNVFEYPFGQAVCQQALEHYEEAIESYRMSLQQEPTNPAPFFLMAGC